MEKVYRSSKWWEVKDWGEILSELMIVKKQLQKTVHSTVLLGWFYLLYMLYSNSSRVVFIASYKLNPRGNLDALEKTKICWPSWEENHDFSYIQPVA